MLFSRLFSDFISLLLTFCSSFQSGYRNPSVIVSIGTCTFKLISKLSNLEIVKDVNPVYNHVIKFKIEPPIEDNLSVTFMEYEGGKAVVIGKSVISVAGLKWGEEKVFDIKTILSLIDT